MIIFRIALCKHSTSVRNVCKNEKLIILTLHKIIVKAVLVIVIILTFVQERFRQNNMY